MLGGMFGEFVTLSGVSARIALGRNAPPDHFFLIRGHKDPLSDFSDRAAATPANIIESGRTHCDAGCIGAFVCGLHHCVEVLNISFINSPSNDSLYWIE